MKDGVRLAARLWLPDGAMTAPVAALLEYIPYRKADMVRARDERNHPYFAAHGYACLRVDMRGSGDSEGVMSDMYAADELADARQVINWIAAQPWCSGRVGMFGTSWGGTAALQANVNAPDALKAVIAVCATHDRYEDDIHHMGGCLLTDTFEWGATLPAILAAPPTPNVGPDWEILWQKRLDALSFPLEDWVREEARGEYWRNGSVIHRADELSRPILAIGGWSDRYSNSVLSLLSARPDLVWGVVGPWGHHFPDQGHPGPSIGFQDLALAWWGYWLGDSPKVPDWPRCRVWIRDFDTPADAIDIRNGRWAALPRPEECTSNDALKLGSEAFATESCDGLVPFDLRVGGASGDTGYFGRYGGLPLDQGVDDTLSLTFETPPLDQDRILYGSALLSVQTKSQTGQIVARLNDVTPEGASALVVRTVRNLALDADLDLPQSTEASACRELEIAFPTTAYRFSKGHRIRLSLSSSYWPLIWPQATKQEARLEAGQLVLPLLGEAPRRPDADFAGDPDLPIHKTFETICAPRILRFSEQEHNGLRVEGWRQPRTATRYNETDTIYGFETSATYRIIAPDPLSAEAEFEHSSEFDRPDGIARVKSHVIAKATRTQFLLEGRLTVRWCDKIIATRHWSRSVPRRF